ncbi:hypothetical protein [Shimia sediminis]|uniref:hypothetical protein n=1 Tax=Shimia sediminis TaxID=2497945 RepID=UPI000F8CA102|nr:hypothetical protein [Shimia sediminis]
MLRDPNGLSRLGNVLELLGQTYISALFNPLWVVSVSQVFFLLQVELNQIPRIKIHRVKTRVISAIKKGQIPVILAPDHSLVISIITPQNHAKHLTYNSFLPSS